MSLMARDSLRMYSLLTPRAQGAHPAGYRRGSLGSRTIMDECTCDCHRMAGVYHCVPCCYPKAVADDDPLDVKTIDDDPIFLQERG